MSHHNSTLITKLNLICFHRVAELCHHYSNESFLKTFLRKVFNQLDNIINMKHHSISHLTNMVVISGAAEPDL